MSHVLDDFSNGLQAGDRVGFEPSQFRFHLTAEVATCEKARLLPQLSLSLSRRGSRKWNEFAHAGDGGLAALRSMIAGKGDPSLASRRVKSTAILTASADES